MSAPVKVIEMVPPVSFARRGRARGRSRHQEAARAKVSAWIEDYNTYRRHLACQMMSPIDYERALAA